jgi:hypothetical protein
MVVEHLAEPCRVFAEIRRVLTPGGLFLFHTPNLKGYIAMLSKYVPNGIKRRAATFLDGRQPEDVYPTYYRCNTEEAITRTAQSSGLNVAKILYIPTTTVFGRIPPMAAIELLWIRATMRPSLSRYRTNILGLLRN